MPRQARPRSASVRSDSSNAPSSPHGAVPLPRPRGARSPAASRGPIAPRVPALDLSGVAPSAPRAEAGHPHHVPGDDHQEAAMRAGRGTAASARRPSSEAWRSRAAAFGSYAEPPDQGRSGQGGRDALEGSGIARPAHAADVPSSTSRRPRPPSARRPVSARVRSRPGSAGRPRGVAVAAGPGSARQVVSSTRAGTGIVASPRHAAFAGASSQPPPTDRPDPGDDVGRAYASQGPPPDFAASGRPTSARSGRASGLDKLSLLANRARPGTSRREGRSSGGPQRSSTARGAGRRGDRRPAESAGSVGSADLDAAAAKAVATPAAGARASLTLGRHGGYDYVRSSGYGGGVGPARRSSRSSATSSASGRQAAIRTPGAAPSGSQSSRGQVGRLRTGAGRMSSPHSPGVGHARARSLSPRARPEVPAAPASRFVPRGRGRYAAAGRSVNPALASRYAGRDGHHHHTAGGLSPRAGAVSAGGGAQAGPHFSAGTGPRTAISFQDDPVVTVQPVSSGRVAYVYSRKRPPSAARRPQSAARPTSGRSGVPLSGRSDGRNAFDNNHDTARAQDRGSATVADSGNFPHAPPAEPSRRGQPAGEAPQFRARRFVVPAAPQPPADDSFDDLAPSRPPGASQPDQHQGGRAETSWGATQHGISSGVPRSPADHAPAPRRPASPKQQRGASVVRGAAGVPSASGGASTGSHTAVEWAAPAGGEVGRSGGGRPGTKKEGAGERVDNVHDSTAGVAVARAEDSGGGTGGTDTRPSPKAEQAGRMRAAAAENPAPANEWQLA